MNTTIPVLLDGVTGSGKTHIYQELITHYLRNDLSVLYLSAEIFLTQQLEKRLANYFQNHIILSHSKLTAVQRRNIWLDCLHETTAKLYLGPRSNLFLPFHKLGLIIIDESHDTSYKQENAPRYHARDVGAKLAQLSNAKLVLGSATHDITTIRLAQLGRLKTVNLHHRHKNQKLPNVSVIDIKGVHRPLSPELLKAMRLRLELGQQSLLLHNRRGSARRLSCEDCGNTLLCPRCDGGLVFHADEGRLRCHICNYNQFPPSICPVCRSHNLHYHGFGTKQLVSEVQKHFPEAKIARIDRDEALKNSFSNTLVAIEKGEIDILIGTQMVAKGLDFPFLTLVGIVAGDELLFGDDFQSRERGMSLILQASGRAGRAEKIGEVLIQTYQPDNPNWRNILSHDWANFYSEELVRRKKFGYPPYQFLSRINFFASSADKAQARAEEWLRDTSMPDGIKMLGPAIPNHPRTPRGYCAHVICKASRRSLLTQLASLLPRDTSYDIDPISLF